MTFRICVVEFFPTLKLFFFFRKALRPNGIIVVKENTTRSGEVEKDEDDSSVTRPDELLKTIFARADMTLLRDLDQKKFPDDLYPVRMYAMKPRDPAQSNGAEEKCREAGLIP